METQEINLYVGKINFRLKNHGKIIPRPLVKILGRNFQDNFSDFQDLSINGEIIINNYDESDDNGHAVSAEANFRITWPRAKGDCTIPMLYASSEITAAEEVMILTIDILTNIKKLGDITQELISELIDEINERQVLAANEPSNELSPSKAVEELLRTLPKGGGNGLNN